MIRRLKTWLFPHLISVLELSVTSETHQNLLSQWWCVCYHHQPTEEENTPYWASGGGRCAAIGPATNTELTKTEVTGFFSRNLEEMWHVSGENLLCRWESLLSVMLYLLTLLSPDFLCHTQLMVTVVLVTLTTFRLSTSIRAGKAHIRES